MAYGGYSAPFNAQAFGTGLGQLPPAVQEAILGGSRGSWVGQGPNSLGTWQVNPLDQSGGAGNSVGQFGQLGDALRQYGGQGFNQQGYLAGLNDPGGAGNADTQHWNQWFNANENESNRYGFNPQTGQVSGTVNGQSQNLGTFDPSTGSWTANQSLDPNIQKQFSGLWNAAPQGNNASGYTQPQGNPNQGLQPGPWNMTPGSYPNAPGMGTAAPQGAPATGGGGGSPGGGSAAPGGAPSLGNLMSPDTTLKGIGPIAPVGNDLSFDPSKYLDPSMAFTMGQGLQAVDSAMGANGLLNSGAQARGILDYSQGLASQNWQQAAQQAAQQQGFGFQTRQADVQNALQAAGLNAQIGNMQNQYGLGVAQLGQQGQEFNANLGFQGQMANNQFGLSQAALSGQLGYQQQQLALSQLGMLGQLGLGGAQSAAGAAGTYGTNLANLLAIMGQTQGTGTIGAANQWNQGITGALGGLGGLGSLGMLMQMYPQLFQGAQQQGGNNTAQPNIYNTSGGAAP